MEGLPTSAAKLIRLMQAVGFGSIEFPISQGGPDSSRPWRVIRTVKLGVTPERRTWPAGNFVLRHEHESLIEALSGLADGQIVRVKIVNGLPSATMEIEEVYAVT